VHARLPVRPGSPPRATQVPRVIVPVCTPAEPRWGTRAPAGPLAVSVRLPYEWTLYHRDYELFAYFGTPESRSPQFLWTAGTQPQSDNDMM
jgi:hypothetical protein